MKIVLIPVLIFSQIIFSSTAVKADANGRTQGCVGENCSRQLNGYN